MKNEDEIVTQLTNRFGNDAVYSSTKLETYAKCHFRFFLKYIIKLEEPEDLEEGFDPKRKGSIIHKILYRFFQERESKGLKKITEMEKETAKTRIHEIASDIFKEILTQGAAWEAQKHLHLGEPERSQGIFGELLDLEVGEKFEKFQPIQFEMKIGDPGRKKGLSVESSNEPIRLSPSSEKSKSFMFHGFIDRIDATEQEKFIIFDYKTGKFFDKVKQIQEGQSFQLPLYLLAAEQILGKTGVGGSYYLLAQPTKVEKNPTLFDADFRDSLFPFVNKRSVVKDFRKLLDQSIQFALLHIEAIKQGQFFPNANLDGCPSYCEYRAICRHEPMRAFNIGGNK